MNQLTLSRLITRLLAASVAVVGTAGCAAPGTVVTETELDTFAPPKCSASSILSVEGLSPAAATDYIALRDADGIDATAKVRLLSETGSKCATAANKTACLSALDAVPGAPGFNSCVDHPCPHTLAVTQGDSARGIGTAAELLGFLGAIDTPQEAALVAFAEDYDLSCSTLGEGGVRVAPDGNGYEVLASKLTKDCSPVETTGYKLKVTRTGTVSVLTSAVIRSSGGCVGRRPAGLDEQPCSALTAVGAYFAEVAQLEAASVTAFDILRDELLLHGAPAELVEAAMAAAADEVRHEKLMAAIARRYGATAPAPKVTVPAPRPLFEVLLENAVEGCVRETFGAFVGAFQAERARDEVVARAMAGIAEDEARHAELAWRIAAWARPLLSDEERATLLAAQRQAIALLYREATVPLPDEAAELAGLPRPEEATAMLQELEAQLWRA